MHIEDTEHRSSEQKINDLINEVAQVIRGKRQQIELVMTCLLAKGHILMEDNPGTGKTVLAKSIAHAISGQYNTNEVLFKRIQFTPDLLPMDLLGAHIFDEEKKDFIFRKGPLFCNILLADEINRASPKVQSALLECMAEGQVTIGDTTYPLENLFFTIATQNPIEMEGTYPLPAAQLDRFFMKINFGYVDAATELDIYKNYLAINKNLNELKQVLTLQEILELQKEVDEVHVHDEIIISVRNIIHATREQSSEFQLGASTRAGITFIKCLKAYALVKNRSFVIEDDIHDITHAVLDHRLIYKSKEAKNKALDIIVKKELDRLYKLKLFK